MPSYQPFIRKHFYVIAISLLITLSLALDIAAANVLEGVVFSSRGPVPDSIVTAYPDYISLVKDTNGIRSGPGEKEGQYKLDLPPGLFYLAARGERDGRRLFSYHGVNPISVSSEYNWLPFFLVEESESVCTIDKGQGIGGLVSYRGTPLDHGVVSVYQQQDGKFRGMGLLTNTINGDGRFHFNLEPGSYVIIARKNRTARGIGPVLKGDLFCYPSANPVTINAGQFCEMKIQCYPRDDLETYLDVDGVNPQGRRHESRRDASLWDLTPETAQTLIVGESAVIEGRVVDLMGKPVRDLIVTAYPSLGINPFQMHVLRLITNTMARTDRDGRYKIELPEGGRYYLQAREKIGEAPNRYELYGLYEGNHNHAININGGENRSGINIQVEPIMPFSELQQRINE